MADMVLIDGNPAADSNDLLKVVTTIKGGRIVSDKRNVTKVGRSFRSGLLFVNCEL